MDIQQLQRTIDEIRIREEQLAARQQATTSDRERYELELQRRVVTILSLSTIRNEKARELIGEIDRRIAGEQGSSATT